MKKAITGIVILLAIFVVFTVGKNMMLQSILTRGLSQATHVPVSIGSLNAQFSQAKISIKDLKVRNPRGFHEDLMLDAPEIAIDFEPAALWRGKMHFQEVKFNLRELIVIRNAEGKLNMDTLKPQASSKAKDEASKSAKAPKLQIDKLFLTVGKVTYKDYTLGKEPVVQTFDVGIDNREYRNIDDPQTLVSLIVFETLTRTTLARLANLDMSFFQQDASGVLSSGLDLLGANSKKAQESAQKLLNIFK